MRRRRVTEKETNVKKVKKKIRNRELVDRKEWYNR